jgi:hypothetical protein
MSAVAQQLMVEVDADTKKAEGGLKGLTGGYRFLLETPTFSIKWLKGVPNRTSIYVEMRAYGLRTHEGNAIGACEAARTFIRETLLAEEDLERTTKMINLDVASCSRLDLFLNWQGGWRIHPSN